MVSHSSNLLSIQNQARGRGWWGWGLADSVVGWQGALQGLGRRQIQTRAFKHGRDVEGLGKKTKKKNKKKPDTHVQLLNLNCNEMWTHRKKKQAGDVHSPPSKQWGLLVCSLSAHQTGGACSLRCGSGPCRRPAEPGRTAVPASAAEPHATSTSPAGRTTWRKWTCCYSVQRTMWASSAIVNNDRDDCSALYSTWRKTILRLAEFNIILI